MEETEIIEEVYDEAKVFSEEVNKIINHSAKLNKNVEYRSDNLLILSLKDEFNGIFEVYNMIDNEIFPQPKLVYIGDKGLRKSYLLNLINKEENRAILKENYSR